MVKKGFSWRVQQERGPVPTAATSSSQRAGALASRRLKGASCRHSCSYITHPLRVAWHCMELRNPGSMPHSPLWAQDSALRLGVCFPCGLIQSLPLVNFPGIADPGPESYPWLTPEGSGL